MGDEMWALPLDDPRWQRLKRAYSSPEKFLPSLAELEAAPGLATRIARRFADENYVCHQFGPSENTVAVVPHFVRAARRLPAPDRVRILQEVGYYATLLGVPLRSDDPHIRPDAEVRDGYNAAVRSAVGLYAEVLTVPCDESEAVVRWAVMAGLHGHTHLARALFKQVIYSCEECPKCGAEFDLLSELGRGF